MTMPIKHDDFNGLVSETMKTNSRIVADKFEKNHRDVLRAIRDLIDSSPVWGMRNFAQTPYVDAQNGQTYQMYEMTRDGYSMLVMGFTGKEAMGWKIRFLDAFNAMERQIRSSSASDPMENLTRKVDQMEARLRDVFGTDLFHLARGDIEERRIERFNITIKTADGYEKTVKVRDVKTSHPGRTRSDLGPRVLQYMDLVRGSSIAVLANRTKRPIEEVERVLEEMLLAGRVTKGPGKYRKKGKLIEVWRPVAE